MDFDYASTAEGLVQRFRNNDASNDTWTIDEYGWESMGGWTPSQGREVMDAARQNTSLRTVVVYVFDEMTDVAIDVFAIIVGRLHRVIRFKVLLHLEAAPAPPDTLDKLCAAIAKCRSDVRDLVCRSCVSPRGFLALAESFPTLETLEVWGPRHPPHLCQACAAADDFAAAFASAAAWGLPSLRRVRIGAIEMHSVLPALLSAVHTSSSVRVVDVDIPHADDDLKRAARCFCTCAKSVETFIVGGETFPEVDDDDEEMETEGMTDMTAFFDMGPIPSFSPTVTQMEFFQCDFRHIGPEALVKTEKMVKNAVKALKNVQFLRFGRCKFPSVMKVVEGLPRLTKLSCVSRPSVDRPYESMTEGGEYDPEAYGAVNNQLLEDLCLAVERKGSLLNDIELDLVSAEGESFPAIVRLMGACKGRLVLNLGELSWRVSAHLVEGAQRLRHDLKDLRLRFVNCELEDPNYADIFQSFISNRTLDHLELGFDENAELDTTELSSAAILGLIDSNNTLRKLSFRGLRPNVATEILEGIMPVLASTNRSLRALEFHRAADLSECLPRARALALDMLEENDVLASLVGFAIPEGGPVEGLLRQNRYGRIFLRADDPTPIGIWATVLARISHDKEVGIMYRFLRAKPGLVRRLPRPSGPSTPSSAGRKRGRVTEGRIG